MLARRTWRLLARQPQLWPQQRRQQARDARAEAVARQHERVARVRPQRRVDLPTVAQQLVLQAPRRPQHAAMRSTRANAHGGRTRRRAGALGSCAGRSLLDGLFGLRNGRHVFHPLIWLKPLLGVVQLVAPRHCRRTARRHVARTRRRSLRSGVA
eukprot:4884883-Prymnesium_polylepis.1